MTSAQMAAMNRRTRIMRALQAGICKDRIAGDEGVTMRYVRVIAHEEKLPACNHLKSRCGAVRAAEGAD